MPADHDESIVCPISGCGNRTDSQCVIEFTIDGVEGIVRARICHDCHKKVSHGVISGLSLAPKFNTGMIFRKE